MQLEIVRRYLGSGKLELKESQIGTQYFYRLEFEDGSVNFPILLFLPTGTPDGELVNEQSLAEGLGLTLNEFQMSANCGLSRHCILVKLSWHLLKSVHCRLTDFSDSAEAFRALAAMTESVTAVLKFVMRDKSQNWQRAEYDSFQSIHKELLFMSNDLNKYSSIGSLFQNVIHEG